MGVWKAEQLAISLRYSSLPIHEEFLASQRLYALEKLQRREPKTVLCAVVENIMSKHFDKKLCRDVEFYLSGLHENVGRDQSRFEKQPGTISRNRDCEGAGINRDERLRLFDGVDQFGLRDL